MKEEILALLVAKFTGVSNAILSRIAEKYAKTATTETNLDELVEGITFQTVIDSYGDARATESAQSAVSNYEKKHGLKEGKAIAQSANTPAQPNSGGTENQPQQTDLQKQIAEAVAAAMKPLSDELITLKTEKQAQTFTSTLLSRFKDKKIDEDFYAEALEGRQFNSNEDVEAFASRMETRWEKYSQKLADEGLERMSAPAGGSGTKKDEISPELKERIERNSKEAVSAGSAIQGLPQTKS